MCRNILDYVLIVFLICCNTLLFAQYEPITIDTIAQNKIKSFFSELVISDTTRIITTGETHSFYTENVIIYTTAFEALLDRNQNFNLVLERPFVEGYLINEYLKNNDETILEYAEYLDDYYRFQLNKLKEIYDKSENKFEVIGIDLAGKATKHITLLGINHIFENHTRSLESNLSISKEFKTLEKVSKKWNIFGFKTKLKRVCKTIYNKIEAGETYEIEQQYFGKDWNKLKRIILDYHLGRLYYGKGDGNARENMLYERTNNLLRENPKSKYYVHYGAGHITKNKLHCFCSMDNSFISKLALDDIGIISIPIVYNYDSPYFIYKEFSWELHRSILSEFDMYDDKLLDKMTPYTSDNNIHFISTERTDTSEDYDYILILNKTLGQVEY